MLIAAFTENPPRPGADLLAVTLDNFAILSEPLVHRAAGNSLVIALGATVLAVLIGGFLAFATARSDIPARGLVGVIGIAPLFLPGYVGALAWATLASPAAGFLNIAATDLGIGPLVNVYSYRGMIFVLGIFYAPYAYLLIHSTMSLMSPDLEDAATVHGASPWRTLRSTTLPLAAPGIAGSALLVFVLTFENFPVAQALGSPGGIDTACLPASDPRAGLGSRLRPLVNAFVEALDAGFDTAQSVRRH